MANITLTGCLNPSTGQVVFDLDTPCGKDVIKMFYGCLVTAAGANFGKIKVVITGSADPVCDGTYYGCVNWATGKFSVDVPEECCTEYIAGNNCSYCDAGETPKYILVTFSGCTTQGTCAIVSYIDCGSSSSVILSGSCSGSLILEQDPSNVCRWIMTGLATSVITSEGHRYTTCSNPCRTADLTMIDVSVTKYASGKIHINIIASEDKTGQKMGAYIFTSPATPTESPDIGYCVQGNYTDNWRTQAYNCNGGEVLIEELW